MATNGEGRAAQSRPNVLLVVSDEERQRQWLGDLALPNRQRIIDNGTEFTNYYTNVAPCSPARGTIFTGQHIWHHGVTGNVGVNSMRTHGAELSPSAETLGHWLRASGYQASYIGKWHLSTSRTPDLDGFGFSDWQGDDLVYRGMAASGCEEDAAIGDQAVAWLANAPRSKPWFLAVNFINPHDILWYPLDQPDYRASHPDELAAVRAALAYIDWRADPIPMVEWPMERVFDRLPDNFADDLGDKPAIHSSYAVGHNKSRFGCLERSDIDGWLKLLDYYYWLHQRLDEQLGRVLDALDASGAAQDTIVMFTSDHGDMAGGHALRGKGPFTYEENVNLPLYVSGPGIARQRVDALGSHVDLAPTILGLTGCTPKSTLPGVDLTDVLRGDSPAAREAVIFGMDRPYYTPGGRYALRGYFDGRTKFARYYGHADGAPAYDNNTDIAEQDLEWYDLSNDPGELTNLAQDPARADEARERFEYLLELEQHEIEGPLSPTPA